MVWQLKRQVREAYKFKNERYLNVDTIQTIKQRVFKLKGVSYASMQKEKSFAKVHLCDYV